MNSVCTRLCYAKMFIFSNFLGTTFLIAENFIGLFGIKVDVRTEALLTKNAEVLHFSRNNLVK